MLQYRYIQGIEDVSMVCLSVCIHATVCVLSVFKTAVFSL